MFKKDESVEVTVFLLGDAITAAKSGQQNPNGYYNLESMLKVLIARGGKVFLCGTCIDARALQKQDYLKAVFEVLWMS